MINPKNLKKSILDYAIRGELSAKFRRENADNTTAFDEIAAYNAKITQIKGQRETLLLQIEKQHKSEKNAHRKARLKTLSGSLKNKIKTYRTITPLNQNPDFTPPFDIPKEWAWVKLGEITNYGNTIQVKPTDLKFNDWILELEDIEKENGVLLQRVKFQERNSKSNKIKFQTGDILFGTLRPYLQKVIIADENGFCSSEIMPFRTFNFINNKYIFYYLLSNFSLKHIEQLTYGTRMPRLGRTDGENLPIPLPPLAEQKFIAGQLEQALTACEQYESTVNALLNLEDGLFNKISKSVLDYAIHGELSAQYRRENAPAVIASRDLSRRSNLPTTENQANDYNDKGIATTATQSRNDGVLTAFDEIAAYNAKITQIKGQRETLLLQIEKQHKSEKNAHRKARLKTLSGSLKNKIKTYRTITPLNQNPEFTPPFDIPKEWAWVKLGEICEIVRGGSPRPIENYLTNSENGLNWIKISDTDIGGKYIRKTAQKITKDGLHKTRFVKAGSLLLTNSMSFGRPYILEIDGCIHDGWLVLSKFQNLATIDFLFNLLTCGYVQKSFRETVVGAVVKNLSTEKVQETIIPLPPLAEQKFIAGQLEKLLDLCKKLKTKP